MGLRVSGGIYTSTFQRVCQSNGLSLPVLINMDVYSQLQSLLVAVLQLDIANGPLPPETRLLGAIPEFDSMTVVTLITGLEERFGIVVNDDEIESAVFATVGSLYAFLQAKLG